MEARVSWVLCQGDSTKIRILRLTPWGEVRENFLKKLRWEKGDSKPTEAGIY